MTIPKKDSMLNALDIEDKSRLCQEIKILGITFQDNLKWDSHINSVCKSASQNIYILRKMKQLSNITKSDLLQIYKSHILSRLEYNAPVFVGLNGSNSEKLEKIRRRCRKIICGNECECDDFTELRLRRRFLSLKCFNNILFKEDHILHDIK